MKGISRVLCAVDIDDADGSAAAQALALARSRGARLLLLCAVRPGEPLNERATERAACLLKIRRHAEAARIDVHTCVEIGDPAEIVRAHASARSADLIVISVEHGRAEGRAWGAVAEDVLRSAPCATLVVPAGARIRSSFTNLLCAVDVASDGPDPVPMALQLSGPLDRTVTVLHVVVDREEGASALPRLQALIPRQAGVKAVAHVAVGDVAPEILRAARRAESDVIVIAARARSRVGRKLFGVTRELLAGSSCPVLAAPVDHRHRPDRQAA